MRFTIGKYEVIVRWGADISDAERLDHSLSKVNESFRRGELYTTDVSRAYLEALDNTKHVDVVWACWSRVSNEMCALARSQVSSAVKARLA